MTNKQKAALRELKSERYKPGMIAVDLDGTLATHYWGNGDGVKYDPLRIGAPVPAMVERVKAWLAEGREVVIFTARVHPGGSAPGHLGNDVAGITYAIQSWCFDVFGERLPVTHEKSFRITEIWDDRAVRVRADQGEPCCDHYRGKAQ